MFANRQACIFIFLGLALSGCATNWIQLPMTVQQDQEQQIQQVPVAEPAFSYRPDSQDRMTTDADAGKLAYWPVPPHQFNPSYTHKAIDDYAEQLAMQLLASVRDTGLLGRVGVSSFVYLDESLQNTDLLGNQLAEALMTEVQQFGLAVVDFKMTDEIAVHTSGDYVFSRDAWDLAEQLAIDYVLAGTMKRSAKGISINARMVHSAEKIVIASGKVDIPHFIVADLAPQYVLLNGD